MTIHGKVTKKPFFSPLETKQAIILPLGCQNPGVRKCIVGGLLGYSLGNLREQGKNPPSLCNEKKELIPKPQKSGSACN